MGVYCNTLLKTLKGAKFVVYHINMREQSKRAQCLDSSWKVQIKFRVLGSKVFLFVHSLILFERVKDILVFWRVNPRG